MGRKARVSNLIQQLPGPTVVSSHDHRFIDTVATHALNGGDEPVLPYPGDDSESSEAKRAGRERREKEFATGEPPV